MPFDPYGIRAAYASRGTGSRSRHLGRAKSGQNCDESRWPPTCKRSTSKVPYPTVRPQTSKSACTPTCRGLSKAGLDLMTRNGKSGLILVLFSLILFLNWRVAFWAAVGLPISFMGTFIMMWAFGETLNLISLMGLIIVLGIIVDDAIVIGENIYRHIEEGMPPKRAAVVGAEEVMWPVTVAILTTIGAFAPLLFIKGQIGDFMGVLPIVVLSALTVSLVEALLILPAHLGPDPART